MKMDAYRVRTHASSDWQVGDLPHKCRSLTYMLRGAGLRPASDFFSTVSDARTASEAQNG